MSRRPAAAKPSPRRAVLRRPAARGEAGAADAEGEVSPVLTPGEWEKKFEAGDIIPASAYPLGSFKKGDWIQSEKANYSGEVCKVALKVEKVSVEDGEAEATVIVTGTQSENLLKFVSGQPGIKLRAHLCHRDCDQLRSNPDLLHLKDFQRIKPGSVTGWEENLIAVDENAELRREMKEKTDKKEKKEKEAAEESSQSGESKKARKRKKKKKERKEKKKKVGGRSQAKKPLEALYGNTGLDPDSKKRKRIVARMKKKLKKAKTSSSSSSASSSTSTSEGETVEDDLLQDRSKLQKIATMAPGVLAASSLQTMKSYIMQSSGNPWHLEEGSLPPVLSQYARQYLLGKASGGIRREIETLVCIGDYLLLGRAAEACDCLVQRVKSLEMTLAGQSWATSQKLEIIPNVDAGVASRAELQLAQKEAALDMKAKGSSPAWPRDKGKGKGKDKEGGKDKGKNKGKAPEAPKKNS